MSKIIQEQIEVMQHFVNGRKIEYREKTFNNNNTWTIMPEIKEIQFNFADFDYRIKEQKGTIVIEKWLLERDGEITVEEGNKERIDNWSSWKKVKLLCSYEVEI